MTFSNVDMNLCTHTPYDHLLKPVYYMLDWLKCNCVQMQLFCWRLELWFEFSTLALVYMPPTWVCFIDDSKVRSQSLRDATKSEREANKKSYLNELICLITVWRFSTKPVWYINKRSQKKLSMEWKVSKVSIMYTSGSNMYFKSINAHLGVNKVSRCTF